MRALRQPTCTTAPHFGAIKVAATGRRWITAAVAASSLVFAASAPSNADALEWRFAYDDQGALARMVDPAGRATTWTTERLDDGSTWRVRRAEASAGRRSLLFDPLGRLREAENDVATLSFDYDGFSRLSAVTGDQGPTIQYAYDAADRMTRLDVGAGWRVDFAYDFRGRLAAMTTPAGKIQYDEYEGGRVQVRTLPNGVRSVVFLNAERRPERIEHSDSNNRMIARFAYAYQPDGLIAQIIETDRQGTRGTSFKYDAMQRLVAVTRPTGLVRFEYDENRLSVLGASGDVTTAQSLDPIGRMVGLFGQTCGHDGAGNLKGCDADAAQRRFQHDHLSRLAVATSLKGEARYRYGPDDRLLQRRTAAGTTRYWNDPDAAVWRPLRAERDGQATHFLWEGDVLLAARKGGAWRFYLHDHLGSARYAVDAAGAIVERFDYTPFGAPTEPREADGLTPGFAGLLWDETARLYIAGPRSYAPDWARFLEPDPEMRAPTTSSADLSLYAYAGYDPINYVDRTGHDREAVNAGAIDWGRQIHSADRAFRQVEQANQKRRMRQLGGQLETVANAYAKGLADFYLADDAFLHEVATDTLEAARKAPPGKPVDPLAILLRNADARFKDRPTNLKEIENRLRDMLPGGFKGDNANLYRPPARPSDNLAGKIRRRFIGGVANALTPSVGRLRTLDELSAPSGSANYRNTFMRDMRQVFDRFAQTSYRAANVHRTLIDAHLGGGAIKPPTKSLIRGTPATAALSAAGSAFTAGLEGVAAGVQFLDITTRALQAAMPPLALQRRTENGWTGTIEATTPEGHVRWTDKVEIDPFWNFQGSIRQTSERRFTSPFGVSTRTIDATTAANPVTRAIFQLRPLGVFIEPGVTSSVDKTHTNTSYREMTKGGVRRQEPIAARPSRVDQSLADIARVDRFVTPPSSQPSSVGGIYLAPTAANLNLGSLAGIALDPDSGDLVLLGQDVEAIVSVDLDMVVAVFRCVYGMEAPFVSIDPGPDPEGPAFEVRLPDCLRDSFAGWALFEADRALKAYSLKRDNITGQPIESSIPGHESIVDLSLELGNGGRQGWERFWITPRTVRITGDRVAMIDVDLEVRAMPAVLRNGALEDADPSELSPAGDRFRRWFTENYDAIAEEYVAAAPAESGKTAPVRVFDVVKQLAALTAVAEHLRDRGERMPHWMYDFAVKMVPTPRQTPSITAEASRLERRRGADGVEQEATLRVSIYGGVKLGADASDIETAAVAPQAAPVLKALANLPADKATGSIVVGTTKTPVAALPGAAKAAAGANRLERIDLTASSDLATISLRRRYSSFFHATDGDFGDGWTLDLPRLRRSASRIVQNGQESFARIYTLSTPLGSETARFSEKRFVPELNATLQTPPGRSPFLGLGAVNIDWLYGPAIVVVRHDGARLYFGEASGRLIGREENGRQIRYSRDARGQIKEIALIDAGQITAAIALERDDAGRIVSARADDGTSVAYAYKGDRLHRAVGGLSDETYAHEGGLLVSTVRSGAPAVRYAYNQRGQIVRRDDGEEQRYFTYAAISGGVRVTVMDRDGRTVDMIEYDRRGRVARRYAQSGVATVSHMPDGGKTLRLTAPDGAIATIVRDPQDGVTFKRSDGGVVKTRRDQAGRLTAVEVDGREVRGVTWRSDGQLGLAETETAAVTPQYAPSGALEAVMLTPPNPGRRVARWLQLTSSDDGRTVQGADYTGADVRLETDAAGALRLMRSNGVEVGVDLDERRRLANIHQKSGPERRIVYADDTASPTGFVINRRDASATLRRDPDDATTIRLRQFDGGMRLLEMDTAGRPIAAGRPDGVTMAYGYDAMGALTDVAVGDAYRLDLAYDETGRPVRVRYNAIAGLE